MYSRFIFFVFVCCFSFNAFSQYENDGKKQFDPETNKLAQRISPVNADRVLRYKPEGDDFVIVNGRNKFNRALYGSNTGFRLETGDVPEFALYLPNMGGNLHFFISNKKTKKPLNDAVEIVCRYRAGSRIYEIKDPMLGNGSLVITALALSQSDGFILSVKTVNIASNIQLSWFFGGAADKRFSREGDLGVDPIDAFELKPEYCKGNKYSIRKNTFELSFGRNNQKKLIGIFPSGSKLNVTDTVTPMLNGHVRLKSKSEILFAIKVPDNEPFTEKTLPSLYKNSESFRVHIASRIKINTPDPYINTLGGVLATAADAIWDGQVWLHGAIGWRMPLNGWRAAYTGDVLGWHDRARTHFNAYAVSQVKDKPVTMPHPVQDSALNLARSLKKWGTPMYSNGYICRNPNRNDQMHHYDMNLCYIDELLWHFNWTGDLDYARKMWPVLTSHLAWEKQNFDPENDGLYDAYASIWASDALYYNSGAVTHSSAYNYRANKLAGELADKLGYDGAIYKQEAQKILTAINARLWLKSKGHWAEFQDGMGAKRIHESAAVWTIYHAIDSKIHDNFQGYQALRYVDTEIPHIPVVATGLKDEGFSTISTSNWMPYSWSINNVAFAEVGHTALAYWQAGLADEGFRLFKSSVLDGMYLGASPGNVGQISYYDAARGECYRDFGDPIGVTSRAVVQGLFGVNPDLLNARVLLRPGFPESWNHASIQTPDIKYEFTRSDKKDTYSIVSNFSVAHKVMLQVVARYDKIRTIIQNGKNISWKLIDDAVGSPIIELDCEPVSTVVIEWEGEPINNKIQQFVKNHGESVNFKSIATLSEVYDPQQVLANVQLSKNFLNGKVIGAYGVRTVFVRILQGDMMWWQPFSVVINKPVSSFKAFSNVDTTKCELINMTSFWNDSLTNIFKPRYFSPRSPYTTLQIPTQGIGEWCHPLNTAVIDDSGLRRLALNGVVKTVKSIPFYSSATGRNIAFTSLWDNFPDRISIPIAGKASHAYLFLAGSTNHMQSHFENGIVVAHYTDHSSDTLQLINPYNWCPIEQEFYVDGKAFCLSTERPWRLHLKSGLVSNNLETDLGIKGVYGRKIEGGAAVLLDMPLNNQKTLLSLEFKTTANEVLIGVLGITLQRN